MNVGRYDLLTNSFYKVRRSFNDLSCFFESLEDRTVRIGADDSDVWVFLFEESTGARNSATGSKPGDEVSNLAFSLSPQFRTRSSVVRVGIRRIGILIWIEGIWCFGCDAP